MPQTLTEIKALLNAHGLRPRKRLGQHFLHDAHQMERILRAAEIVAGEVVLEIGPGTGALSEYMLEAGARLVAVEIDRELEPILRQRLSAPFGKAVSLVFADALSGKHVINPAVWDAVASFGAAAFKLIANLPYDIASAVLANLAVDPVRMDLAVVMVQRDVADRLTAAPGGKSYGPLGIVVGAVYEVWRIGNVSPSCFWPRPKVDSTILRLEPRAEPVTADPRVFAAFVKRLFTSRRKQLGTILGRDAPLPEGVRPEMRPQQLSLEQLSALARMSG